MHALLLAETHRCAGEWEAARAAYFEAAGAAGGPGGEVVAGGGEDAGTITMHARIGLGRVELNQAAPGRALGWFLSAERIAPGDWRPRYWRGAALGWLGDHAGAEQSCATELHRTPGELSLKAQRCCAQRKRGAQRAALEAVLTTRTGTLDGAALHALCSAWLTRTGTATPTGTPEHAIGTRLAVAAVGALRYDDEFWERFRADAAARYRVPIPSRAITWCRAEIERRTRERLVSDTSEGTGPARRPAGEALLLRELAAADVLHDLGGLPTEGTGTTKGAVTATLVCGPLMISLLGRQDDLGAALVRAAPTDRRRSRMLFSGLGAATVLLDAERPDEALGAVRDALCRDCGHGGRRTAPGPLPPVCAPDCAAFDSLHPGYASLPDRSSQLAQDAAHVSITALLETALRMLSSPGTDPDAARQRWKDALELAAGLGTEEQVRRRIGEAVLGRTATRTAGAPAGETIALTEAAVSALGESPVRDELRRRLADLLTDQGVLAGNEGNWDDCVRLLRRGMRTDPTADRPRINLSLALQRVATARRGEGRIVVRELLREAKRIVVDDASRDIPDHPQRARQVKAVTEDLRSLYTGWSLELAVLGAYREALGVLDEGLADIPEDDRLLAVRNRLTPLGSAD